MNDRIEAETLREELKETERAVHRLKLAVISLSVAILVLSVALLNRNLRAAFGVVLAIAGILFGVLLFIAGLRLALERLSSSQHDQAAWDSRVGDPSRSEKKTS